MRPGCFIAQWAQQHPLSPLEKLLGIGLKVFLENRDLEERDRIFSALCWPQALETLRFDDGFLKMQTRGRVLRMLGSHQQSQLTNLSQVRALGQNTAGLPLPPH